MAAQDPHFTEFVHSGSGDAFERLVTRHMRMVQAAARRLLGDRSHAAADVAQTVFSQLARRAPTLPPDLVVSVWLHTQTVRAALNVIRGEKRRAARERAAADLMQMNAPDPANSADVNAALRPHIDRALSGLAEVDQQALALRFFERCELQEIGERLGLSAGAVQKRLSRALEKLRGRLSRRGIVLPAAALTLWLSQESVPAAPLLLSASSLTATALQSAGPGAGAASGAGAGGLFSILNFMSGIKSILIGTALGLVGGGFWAGRVDPASSGSSTTLFSRVPPPPDSAAGVAAAQRFAVPEPAGTAEELLAQFSAIINAPDTEVNRMRLEAWLARVPRDQWKPLVELAGFRLSNYEKGKLPELVHQWAKVAPEEAISSVQKITGQMITVMGLGGPGKVRAVSFGGRLATEVFSIWYEAAPDEAGTWLLKNQDDPQRAEMLPDCVAVIGEGLAEISKDSAVRWASQLLGDDLRAAALARVWRKVSEEGSERSWADMCGTLLHEENPDFRHLALKEALNIWTGSEIQGEPGGMQAERWLATLPASPEKRQVAEMMLSAGMQRLADQTQEAWDGRPDTALAVLTAEGPEAASHSAARLITEAGPLIPAACEWLLPLLTGPERETAILHAARQLAEGVRTTGDQNITVYDRDPAGAMTWALELSDPDIRDPMIYGLFQQWLKRRDGSGDAGEWMDQTSLPPEIKNVLRAARQDFDATAKIKETP